MSEGMMFAGNAGAASAAPASREKPDVEGVSWVGDRLVLELKKPIEESDGALVEKVSFREMTGKEFRKLPLGSFDKMSGDTILELAADLSGVPDIIFDKMSAKDCMGVMAIVSFFLNGSENV